MVGLLPTSIPLCTLAPGETQEVFLAGRAILRIAASKAEPVGQGYIPDGFIAVPRDKLKALLLIAGHPDALPARVQGYPLGAWGKVIDPLAVHLGYASFRDLESQTKAPTQEEASVPAPAKGSVQIGDFVRIAYLNDPFNPSGRKVGDVLEVTGFYHGSGGGAGLCYRNDKGKDGRILRARVSPTETPHYWPPRDGPLLTLTTQAAGVLKQALETPGHHYRPAVLHHLLERARGACGRGNVLNLNKQEAKEAHHYLGRRSSVDAQRSGHTHAEEYHLFENLCRFVATLPGSLGS